MKKTIAFLLAVLMLVSVFAGCNPTGSGDGTGDGTGNNPGPGTPGVKIDEKDYTYKSYADSLGTNWNPHTWETNGDDEIQSYLYTPLVGMQILDSEEGVYQWTYEAATAVTDVTESHQADLEKYAVILPDGQTVADTKSGYVFEIKLRDTMKWQDGTPINADTYIYSMKQYLNPEMHNYRANLTYAGESAVAGGAAYYYAGSTAYMDNNPTAAAAVHALSDFTKNDDGVYTFDGMPVYITIGEALAWLSGNSLAAYVGAFPQYFDVDSYNALKEAADEKTGRVALTDDSLALLVKVITATEDWGETDADAVNYLLYPKVYPAAEYDATVGCYKVDDYTIIYVTESQIDINYFLTSLTSGWLVYESLYEGGKDTSGELVTTNYCTSKETTMSYGPYKIESLQNGKQIVFTQNENWYGYEKTESGYLYSITPFEVDGKHVQRYKTTKVVIDVMTDDAAKESFLKGQLTAWAPPAEEVVNYTSSSQLYKVDETYTMSFFFNTGLDNLKKMDESEGNQNSVVLSNINFRKAFSLSIDRADWVLATAGYKPAYALMNTLYFYNIYEDPTSSYRGSKEAMQAVCNLYGVQYGEGTPYATLKDAYESINGYNLTEAKALMKKACEELVAEGLYTAGEEIKIRIGYKKGALDSSDQKAISKFNAYINAAVEGSGFGKITLDAVANVEDRYADVINGKFAIGYGAWGGAAFYPFRNMQVYCDNEQYDIHEAGCWDPSAEKLTLKVKGEDVTMSWTEWSRALVGSGPYANEGFDVKLSVLSQMEQLYLEKYYRIPLAGSTACSLLSYQVKYYTEDYNIMYGFGGLELLQYEFDDVEWDAYVASQGGTLSYE